MRNFTLKSVLVSIIYFAELIVDSVQKTARKQPANSPKTTSQSTSPQVKITSRNCQVTLRTAKMFL